MDTSHRDGEYAKFRAVLRKNFTLKTRGSQLWCTILEVLVPVAFIALMCLPRLFISDESVEMTLHRPAPIQSITWSGRVPGGPTGDGPYRLLWSPVTNADAERVAESAAIDLLCGGGFMTQSRSRPPWSSIRTPSPSTASSTYRRCSRDAGTTRARARGSSSGGAGWTASAPTPPSRTPSR